MRRLSRSWTAGARTLTPPGARPERLRPPSRALRVYAGRRFRPVRGRGARPCQWPYIRVQVGERPSRRDELQVMAARDAWSLRPAGPVDRRGQDGGLRN